MSPFGKMRILAHRFFRAEVRDLEREGQRRIVEREGAGPGNRARHVRDAIMDDAVDFVDRVGVGGRMRGFEAAALVDRDVDQHRAALHRLQHVAGDELRARRRRAPAPRR